MDYEHCIKGKILTNRRIDHYALLGVYGKPEQDRVLKAITSGTIRHLDQAITEHKYDTCAVQALAQRKPRVPRTPSLPTDPVELLKHIFGEDYFA